MKYNVTFEQIVDELVKIFGDKERTSSYNTVLGGQYLGVLGWAGPMSPENRIAFVDAFGEDDVAKAEAQARQRIEAKSAEYAATKHAGYVNQANENETKEGFVPQEGDFVWAIQTGLKNEGGGILGIINDLVRNPEWGERRSLVCVEKVFNVSSDTLEASDFPDRLVEDRTKDANEFPGGFRSDDDDYVDLYDKYKTYYNVAAAVVDENKRWYLIDAEGFRYARYLLLPINWADLFQKMKSEAETALAKRIEEARIEKEKKEAEELAEYNLRCEKWAHLMTDIRPLEKAASDAYEKHGWKSKESKAADRALGNARRKNIATMVHTAFPGLDISIRRNDGWGSAWDLSYNDGPTEEEFNAATDLDLFAMGHDTFDGMTDCAGYEEEKHTSFAEKYMGNMYGDVAVKRYKSDETDAMLAEKIKKVVPEAGETRRSYSYEELKSIADEIGCDVMWLDGVSNHHGTCSIHDLIYAAWCKTSFYVPKEVCKSEPTQAANPNGIQIIDYSEPAIVVTGDTKPIKDELKRLGGKFNSHLSCGCGWVFGKRNKETLNKLDKFLGGAIMAQLPELMKGGE